MHRAVTGSELIGGRHTGSPLTIAMNTPASIIPAILAGRSDDVLAPHTAHAALPNGFPQKKHAKKDAPPGGRWRTKNPNPWPVIQKPSRPAASVGCHPPPP